MQIMKSAMSGIRSMGNLISRPKIGNMARKLPQMAVLGGALALGSGCGYAAEKLLDNPTNISDTGLLDTSINPETGIDTGLETGIETGIDAFDADTVIPETGIPETDIDTGIADSLTDSLEETIIDATDAADTIDTADTKPCVTYGPIIDTDFTAGTATNLVVKSGSITLGEDTSKWDVKYEGTALPGSGWTKSSPFGATESVSGGYLNINSSDSAIGYYKTDPAGLSNATGTLVETRIKINSFSGSSLPSTSGFNLDFADGKRRMTFVFFDDRIREIRNSFGPAYLTTTAEHTYRITFQGNNLNFYIDGAPIKDLSSTIAGAGTTSNFILYGDQETTAGASWSMKYLYVYKGGAQLPYKTPGTYVSAPIDSKVVAADHSGATIDWTLGSGATGGTVSVAVRASNDSTFAGDTVPWLPVIYTKPAVVPSGVIGQFIGVKIILDAGGTPATLTPVIDEIIIGKKC